SQIVLFFGSLRLSFCKFNCQNSAMLYLRCFTSNAKNMVESRDILNYNKIIRKIESDINENTTIHHAMPLSLVNIYRFFL
ncbi:MAG: hypothetical protein WA364_18010, partial [Candidatus Nitrosopolaris sp.]